MYPIMPLGTGGRNATGGTSAVYYPVMPLSTGGRNATGGSSAVMYPVMSPTSSNESPSSSASSRDPNLHDADSWWRTAEAALRRT